jgi:putative hydrolase of the HAD superfamily
MIRAVIFDLDSCLSAADEIGASLLEPIFEAVRRASAGAYPEDVMARAFAECWRFAFDDVASRFAFSRAMREAGFRAFAELEVRGPMKGYPDLGTLGEIDARRYLVTSGFRRLQESKILALGISALFEGVTIDAIDEPGRKGKEKIFQEILERDGWRPDEVLVVGDNPASEIAAGNRLGCATVQILRPGVERGDNARYVVSGLEELKALIRG